MNRSNLQPGGQALRSFAPLSQLIKQVEKLEASPPAFPTSIVVECSDLDCWGWLSNNTSLSKFVWSDRNSSDVWAGLGEAARVEVEANGDVSNAVMQCRELLGGDSELHFFGGLSFDGDAGWPSFGAGQFVLPRLQLSRGKLILAIMTAEDVGKARHDLEQMCFEVDSLPAVLPSPNEIGYSPSVDGWQTRIDEALALIRSEAVEKIVLSRKTILKFAEPLNPIALAARLNATTHDCFVFCFDTGQGDAFVGATPERLFLRRQNLLQSEVIAGTRMRGATTDEDERLARELLASDKDQREHDIVRKSIRQKLHKFVDHLTVDEQASLLRLARKQHLRSNVEGTLKPGVDDGMLLKRLHPTPAVGGYPTDNALPEIARIEPFNRGWYAAPIGWIGSESAQFAVAIRSGLIESDTLSLYSGAGIVRGSVPSEEWQEVENKIQDFMNVLSG